MNKEKFIEKTLREVYDEDYKAFSNFSNFTVEKMIIEKAMKYCNWWMFFWGVILGFLINIIFDFIIL